ncbi:hypothetical protein GCM10009603_11840 [Nocardiopsis exhalans]
MTTPVERRGSPSPSGKPASSKARDIVSNANQCVMSVERKELPETRYLTLSKVNPRSTAAFFE